MSQIISSELEIDPANIGFPKGFEFPATVQALIEEWNVAYRNWSDKQTDLYDKVDALTLAEKLDGQALKDAVIASKPDPGTKASEKASREIVYTNEIVLQARRAANSLSQKLWASINAHKAEIMMTAADNADAVRPQWVASMARISEMTDQAISERDAGYAGLRFAAQLTGGSLSYDPFFPMEGNFTLAKTHESRPLSISYLVRQLAERLAQGDTEDAIEA